MLRTRRYALALQTFDNRARHIPRKHGIFRKIFKIPSAKGIAVYIHSGRKQNVAAFFKHFFRNRAVKFFHKVLIERRRNRSTARQKRGVRHKPYARRTVGRNNCRHSFFPKAFGYPAEYAGVAFRAQRAVHFVIAVRQHFKFRNR